MSNALRRYRVGEIARGRGPFIDIGHPDAATLQAAIAVAEPGDEINLGGRTVNLSGGTRILVEDLSDLRFRNGRIITNGANAKAFTFRRCSNLVFDGLEFIDQTAGANVNVGLTLENSSRVRVTRSRFDGQGSIGLLISEDTGTPESLECSDIWVEDCDFSDIATFGLSSFPKVLSQNHSFRDLRFTNVGTADGEAGCLKVGQKTRNTLVRGIQAVGGHNVVLINNWETLQVIDVTATNIGYRVIGITFSDHPSLESEDDDQQAGRTFLSVRNVHATITSGFSHTSGIPAVECNGSLSQEGVVTGPVILSGINARGFSRGFVCRPTEALPNIRLTASEFWDCDIPFFSDAANGAVADGMLVDGNVFGHSDPTSTGVFCRFRSTNGRWLRNRHVGLSTNALQLRGDGIEACDNEFEATNPTAAGSGVCILIDDTTAQTYRVRRNTARGGTMTHVVRVSSDSTTPTVLQSGNVSDVLGTGVEMGLRASATTPGSVTGRVQVFDGAGSSLGYLPLYDTIT